MALEVVKAGKVDHNHEDAETGDFWSHLVLLLQLLLVLLASETHENTGILVDALIWDTSSLPVTSKER